MSLHPLTEMEISEVRASCMNWLNIAILTRLSNPHR
jgi:hypothetical protein